MPHRAQLGGARKCKTRGPARPRLDKRGSCCISLPTHTTRTQTCNTARPAPVVRMSESVTGDPGPCTARIAGPPPPPPPCVSHARVATHTCRTHVSKPRRSSTSSTARAAATWTPVAWSARTSRATSRGPAGGACGSTPRGATPRVRPDVRTRATVSDNHHVAAWVARVALAWLVQKLLKAWRGAT